MPPESIPPGQYYISRREPSVVPDGFDHVGIGDWHVVLDSDHEVVPVTHAGAAVGCLFGTILDPDNEIRNGTIDLVSSVPVREAFEQSLSRLVGRFVGIVAPGDGGYLYTDPSGALPAVYDADEAVVGSSGAAIPQLDTEARFRQSLYDDVTERWNSSWLPGPVTYFTGVERVIPNHLLELDSFEQRRFWPGEVSTPTADPDSEIETIVSRLETIFDAIGRQYGAPEMALTAGMDSRALLAVARRQVLDDDIRLFTLDRGSLDVDMHVARRIASDHALPWKPLQISKASPAERSTWLYRTGYAVRSAIMESYPSLRDLDADVRIEGLGGEIARSFYWGPSDGPETTIDAAELLDRFGKPHREELLDAVSTWLDEVSQFDTYTMLDLAYQEHRLGCWGGPQHLGLPTNIEYVCPFFDRSIIESMHRLSPEIRRADEFGPRIVSHSWPELNDYPYNEFEGWRKYANDLRDRASLAAVAVRNPGTSIDFLRRKLTKATVTEN